FGPRPDVAKVLNLTGTEAFGWEVVVPYDLPPPLHSHLLYLKVQTRSGRERFLWGHNLESTLRVGAEAEVEALRARLAKTEAELKTTIGKLEHRLSAIEASRFWRARNAWFRLKQKAGLIDEIWP
ncbi:MAG TPA: hypothetical protein PK413_21230, partial [Thermoanaerobaculia bacterium]|nr:hypothetical protein [Thermoanaerobaculia bacterium]